MIEVLRAVDKDGRLTAAIGKCDCGARLDMLNDRDYYDTIECERCGRLYNSSGQLLRPRSQWEETLEPEDY